PADHFPPALHCSPTLSPLPSFPTRRSSDLHQVERLHAPGGRRRRRGDRFQGLVVLQLDAVGQELAVHQVQRLQDRRLRLDALILDRKSTRLNSSHVSISYAVFCLKKKTHTI